MRSRPGTLAAAGFVVALLGGLAWFLLYLLEPRPEMTNAASPQSQRTVHVLELGGGSSACLADIRLPRDTAQARVQIGTYKKAGQPVTLTMTDTAGRVLRRSDVTRYKDNDKVAFSFPPIAHDAIVDACLRNDGRRRIALYSSPNLKHQSPTTTVDGKEVDIAPAFNLYRAEDRSLLARTPAAVSRMTLFKPAAVTRWSAWALLALLLVCVPVLLWWALVRAWRPGG